MPSSTAPLSKPNFFLFHPAVSRLPAVFSQYIPNVVFCPFPFCKFMISFDTIVVSVLIIVYKSLPLEKDG